MGAFVFGRSLCPTLLSLRHTPTLADLQTYTLVPLGCVCVRVSREAGSDPALVARFTQSIGHRKTWRAVRWFGTQSALRAAKERVIAEMQGYAPYAHEMKSRISGLMVAIRKFATALRK